MKNGKWVISGGWYLQPDMNLLSGESIARQILYGRKFFKDEFDVDPQVAYNLDTFGHNANTPQFLKLSGYRMYTHFRPTPGDKELPDFLYTWRGVDGSEVIGFRGLRIVTAAPSMNIVGIEALINRCGLFFSRMIVFKIL